VQAQIAAARPGPARQRLRSVQSRPSAPA
jgi:hypothetical protein